MIGIGNTGPLHGYSQEHIADINQSFLAWYMKKKTPKTNSFLFVYFHFVI